MPFVEAAIPNEDFLVRKQPNFFAVLVRLHSGGHSLAPLRPGGHFLLGDIVFGCHGLNLHVGRYFFTTCRMMSKSMLHCFVNLAIDFLGFAWMTPFYILDGSIIVPRSLFLP